MPVHKIIVSPRALLAVVKRAMPLVQDKPLIPALGMLLLTVKNGDLTIASSNLADAFISEAKTAESVGSWSVLLPAKLLAETLSALPDSPITLTVDAETNAAEIRQARSRFRLEGDSATNFPRPATPQQGSVLHLNAQTFRDALSAVAPMMANDSVTRPVFTAAYIKSDGGELTIAATDTNTLSEQRMMASGMAGAFEVVLPAPAVPRLIDLLGTSEGAKLIVDRTNLRVTADGGTLVMRLIDDTYPAYRSIIPTYAHPNTLTVERADLLASVRQVTGYSDETTKHVKLHLAADDVSLSAATPGSGNEAAVGVSGEYVGEPMVIGFNARYLIDHLRTLPDGLIDIQMGAPKDAVLFVPQTQPKGRAVLNLLGTVR